MNEMPTDLYNLCSVYDDHIGLSANEGYPLAVEIRHAYHAWQHAGLDAELDRLDGLMREYHRRYETGPKCACGGNDEHVMPGYRVCHPCAETRLEYPWVFEDDPEPDALPWDTAPVI